MERLKKEKPKKPKKKFNWHLPSNDFIYYCRVVCGWSDSYVLTLVCKLNKLKL